MQNLESIKNEITESVLNAWSGDMPLWKLVAVHWSLGFCVAFVGLASVAWLMVFNIVVAAQLFYGLSLSFIGCHSLYILVSAWRRANAVNSTIAKLAIKAASIYYVALAFHIMSLIPAPGLQLGM